MTKIKICGLKSREDVAYVNEARPDFAGFIINVPWSKRSISTGTLRELVKDLDKTIMPVGVFVDAPPSVVAELLGSGVIGAAQFHGHEDEAYLRSVQKLLKQMAPGTDAWSGAVSQAGAAAWPDVTLQAGPAPRPDTATAALPLIKAIRVRTRADIEAANGCKTPMVLLDGGAGDGRCFDWSLLKEMRRPYMLAGGLNEENVTDAIRHLRPWAVDISSGVETGGVKDRDKIRRIVSAVRREDKGKEFE